MTLTLQNTQLQLLPEKAILWPDEEVLFIADLHLGKAEHFRRKGLPVPRAVQQSNLALLQHLLDNYAPKKVFFLGDLFHSRYNPSWSVFSDFLQQYPHISFELVLGNHDILPKDNYLFAKLNTHPEGFLIGPFLLSHHPLSQIPNGQYNLYGHLHPCVRLQGMGTRSGGVRLPCFHFGEKRGVLPAFGQFTGMAEVEVAPEDRVFVVVEDRVMEV